MTSIRTLSLAGGIAVSCLFAGCFPLAERYSGYGTYGGYGHYGSGGYYTRYANPWLSNSYYDPFYPRGFEHGLRGWNGFWGAPYGWGVSWFGAPVHRQQSQESDSSKTSSGEAAQDRPQEIGGDNPTQEPQLDAEGDSSETYDDSGG